MFHVYVDGVMDPAPEAARAVAEEMALLYGVPADELHARLLLGPFRVKAGVDRETADAYAHDLAVIGARVRIEPAQPDAATRASVAQPNRSSLPPQPPRASPSVLPSRTVSRPVSSGLSAAAASRPVGSALPPVGGAAPAMQLGALDGGSALPLALLDGGAPEPAPPSALPASMGPPALPPARATWAAPPVDRFAPPDEGSVELGLELAEDEPLHRAGRRPDAPSAAPGSAPSLRGEPELAARGSTPRLPVAAEPVALRGSPVPASVVVAEAGPLAVALRPVAASPRLRFAAGLLFAIVVGFVPAHVVASIREARAFGAIDDRVAAVQKAADTQERYDALDAFRERQLADKRRAQRDIALTSLLLWAAAGGALGYGWFRRVPWDRFA